MQTQATNNTSTFRNIAFLISAAVAAACIVFIGSSITRTHEPPLSIGRGGRVVIIRLPDPNKENQKDLTFKESFPQMQLPESVTLIPTYWREMKDYPITTRDLTNNEWATVQRLIQSLCLQPPAFPRFATETPNYIVAVQCGITTKQFEIPTTEVPVELTDVLLLTPVADTTNTEVMPNISR